jgi:hypothetical protein
LADSGENGDLMQVAMLDHVILVKQAAAAKKKCEKK